MANKPPDRIAALFARTRAEGRPAVIPFVPAGWPEFDATPEIVQAAIAGGADAIELGLPFSDPLADGTTNQQAYYESLQQGTTPVTLLDTVRSLRASGVTIPIMIMGYVNPMTSYGPDRWVTDAVEAGVDGLIIVDLPPNESAEIEIPAHKAGLHIIYLVAPTSTDDRLRLVTEHSSGFVYCVSLTGTTGARSELPEELPEFIARVRAQTDLPLAIGFGISERRHVQQVAALADAAIIGSAFVRTISDTPREGRAAAVREFVERMTGATPPVVAAE
jgi:tryptophan synthase alpha subunit